MLGSQRRPLRRQHSTMVVTRCVSRQTFSYFVTNMTTLYTYFVLIIIIVHISLLISRWYRAPELLLKNGDYDQAVDSWSTGCILAELLFAECMGANAFEQRLALFPGRDQQHQLQLIVEVRERSSRERGRGERRDSGRGGERERESGRARDRRRASEIERDRAREREKDSCSLVLLFSLHTHTHTACRTSY